MKVIGYIKHPKSGRLVPVKRATHIGEYRRPNRFMLLNIMFYVVLYVLTVAGVFAVAVVVARIAG